MFCRSCEIALILFQYSVYATAVQLMCITNFSKKQKQLGGNPTRVSSSSILCRGSYLLPAAPCSWWSNFFGCLFPINQPLMLDASQLFEHDSDPIYIALLQKSCPRQRRKITSLHFCPLTFNIWFSINLLFEFWLIELPFVSRTAWRFIIFGAFTGSLMYSEPALSRKPQRERQIIFFLYFLLPPFMLHTSFSDHLGAGGVQLTLLPLPPYAWRHCTSTKHFAGC